MGTLMMTGCSSNNQEPKEDAFDYTVEQFADLQLLRYKVHGFEELPLEQKKLVYYLSEAALQGRDILFDQNGKYNLIIRKMLETVYTDYQGDRNDANFKAMETYLKRVWFSNGIHHHYAADKFVPGFTPEFFKQALESVDAAKLPLAEGETLEALCNEVFPVIFDAKVMAKRVNQADGEDLVLTSASNYYDNVTQAEAEAFYGKMKNPNDTMPVMFGMNSRLVKENGKVQEKVWKSGGLYGQAIDKIIYWLEKALTVAENDKQKAVIEKMIQFYKDGDLKTFDEYAILWVKDLDSRVDFVNGFTESYGDPLGMKASWESIVNFKDLEATKRTETIKATLLEVKEAALKEIYGQTMVTTATGGDMTVKHGGHDNPNRIYVLELVLRDGRKWRQVIPAGQVTEVGDLSLAAGELAGREVTITANVDTTGDGLLKCANVRLAANNPMMPVWDAADNAKGYRFFDMVKYQQYKTQDANGFVFQAKPALGKAANDPYLAAMDTNRLTVKARIYWQSNSGNEVEQLFTFKAADVEKAYQADDMVLQLTVTGAGAYAGKLWAAIRIESETGVIWEGVDAQPYTGISGQ